MRESSCSKPSFYFTTLDENRKRGLKPTRTFGERWIVTPVYWTLVLILLKEPKKTLHIRGNGKLHDHCYHNDNFHPLFWLQLMDYRMVIQYCLTMADGTMPRLPRPKRVLDWWITLECIYTDDWNQTLYMWMIEATFAPILWTKTNQANILIHKRLWKHRERGRLLLPGYILTNIGFDIK